MSQRFCLYFAALKSLQQFCCVFIKFVDGYLSISILVMSIKCVVMAFNRWQMRNELCKLIEINPMTSISVYSTKATKSMVELLVQLGWLSTAPIAVATEDVAATMSTTGAAFSAILALITLPTVAAISIGNSYKVAAIVKKTNVFKETIASCSLLSLKIHVRSLSMTCGDLIECLYM